MKVLINYADAKFSSAQRWNSWSAKRIAKFDGIFAFHPDDIDSSFKENHKEIFKEKRGGGLWLWKPYFIHKVMQTLNDGDIIFYCDAGAIFIRYPQAVYDSLSDMNPLFVCDIPLIESCWTKPACFREMGCDTDEIKCSNQIIGTYFALMVNDFTRRFVEEWLGYCCRYELISPAGLSKKKVLNHCYGTNFVSHREDQSIFSLMCKKYGVVPHKDISQRGKVPESYQSEYYGYKEPVHPNDSYNSILYLHKAPSLSTYIMKKIYSTFHIAFIKQIFCRK